MLRINIMDSVDEVRFILYGRLCGPWIPELQAALVETQRTLGNRTIVIDLKQTTSIDSKGIQLLSTMYDKGVRLITSGVVMRHMVETFRKRKKGYPSFIYKTARNK
jgi:anti-anti-sigma regulatory factor